MKSSSLAIGAIIGLVPFLVGAAQAQDADQCVGPYPPFVIDGATATADQINENHTDVVAFLALSDMYQECLVRLMGQDDIKENPSALRVIEDRIGANQLFKEKVGAEYNAAVAAYRAQHPRETPATPPPEGPVEAPEGGQ